MGERECDMTLVADAEHYVYDFVSGYEKEYPLGPYLVVRTAFHRGGVISRHRTLRAAGLAAAKYGRGECACGCCHIVAASEYDDLPYAQDSRSPYAAAQ
jgi:hypothetical protein